MQDTRNTLPPVTAQQNEAALDEARLITETGVAARVAHLVDPVMKQLGFRLYAHDCCNKTAKYYK